MPTVAQLEALLAKSPDDTFLLYGLAQEHAKAGDTDTACSLYDRVIALDPHYCYAYFHKARALEDAERTDEAIATLRLGVAAAREANDQKALGEIGSFLDELEP